jgi:hypothetical protein
MLSRPYFVRVTKREKRACKECEEQGVHSAPLLARIIDKGLASDRVVIDAVVSKYARFHICRSVCVSPFFPRTMELIILMLFHNLLRP